ncbi:PCI domain-containing protein [Ditylenchus destructor]|uniref:PCI domain-containing protein 2 homolog n=1 Tax=Ditylenchus destructor TaxID=166010 RepID=A0AAD4R848_9BILA|nr:PCI domain-containing protein [Ditylenchus destructor]
MRFRDFYDYYDQLSELLQSENLDSAKYAAALLSVKDPHGDLKFLQVINPEDVYRNRNAMDWAFDDIILMHLQTLYFISRGDWAEACAAQTSILQLFNREILQKEKDANWFMPILYIICSDLRLISIVADSNRSAVRRRKTEAASFYEEAAAPIMESYRMCVAESRLAPETTKKIAILNLTNQLFRIYFKINRLHLLKPLIRSIDHVGDLYDFFSTADKITYNYFLGRKAMFDMDLSLSEKSLSFAFENCPSSHKRNKRAILMYLIPVKMFLGHMPTAQLLSFYNLEQFLSVVTSVKDGNLRQLNEALQEHQHFFIKCGIFLMLEKLKVVTYRNLFKKVALILNTHMIKLDAFSVAIRWLGSDMDSDELACILANLIAQKKIKGYISHQKQTLVISKQTPFPPLSTL